MKRSFTIILAGLLFSAFGCATNPVTGKSELSLVSEAQLQQIGREGHPAIIAEYGLYDDPAIQEYVTSVGRRLAVVSHQPQATWTFTVLDDPTVNAFAVPGGYVYITRGILAHLNSEAQLAGVMGHEIAHVTARHSASRISQQQLAGLGLGIASIFSQTVREYSQAAQTALGLVFLKYGRDDENEADAIGLKYTVDAGWDPREIPATYATLKRVGERAGQRLPAFLSTHPDPGDREVRTTTLANSAAAGKTGLKIEALSYVNRLDNMPFGTDPRHGYFDGTHYYHPELKIHLLFPDGWQTQDSRAAVAAREPNGAAVMQLKLAAKSDLSPAAYVQSLQQAGNISGAQGQSETIGGWPAWVGTLAVPQQDGTTVYLAAGYVRMSPDVMFEFLGRSAQPGDAADARIRATMRSLRPLTDPARLSVTPDRVDVVRLASGGEWSQVFPTLTPLAIDLQEGVVINNLEAGETVRSGQTVKVVRPGRRS